MLKKTIAMAMAGASLLAVSGTAFGGERHHHRWGGSEFEVEVENHNIEVDVEAKAESETGENAQYAYAGQSGLGGQTRGFWGWGRSSSDLDQRMTTGEAISTAIVDYVDVASTYGPGCDCVSRRGETEYEVKNHDIDVDVEAEAESETGENVQRARARRGDVDQRMTTGRADSLAHVGEVWVAYSDFSAN